jgi:4-amino-4-deoxy-L-arabinose transferase-like glycosyltransferase
MVESRLASASPETLIRRDVVLLAGLLLLPLLRGFISDVGGFNLHFDEAQYWEWSQYLDWSYYSKGPLVAWLIALSTGLFGHGEWQVRLFAWLAYSGFLLVLFVFARQFWRSRRAGWWAVALGLTTPLYFPLGQVMTTDVFLFLCWTWALWAAWRALYRDQPLAWLELGLAVGLGGLAKPSIAMLPFFLGLGLLATAWGRQELRRWPPWAGAALALLVVSPVILWNAGNDWVMFRHSQGHVLGVAEVGGWRSNLGHLVEFLGGQFLALSPLVAVALARELGRPPRPAEQRLLWGLSLAVLAFFLAKATFSKVQLNWPAPAYIGLLVLFAGHIDALTTGWRRLVIAGMASSVALVTVALFPMLVGLSPAQAPFKELRLWQEPVAEMARQAGEVQFLLVPSYHLAGRTAFYWPERLPVYPVAADRRFSQHDFWPGLDREVGRDAVYLATGAELPERISATFSTCRALPPVPAVTGDGRTLRTLYGWRCADFRYTAWPAPVTY